MEFEALLQATKNNPKMVITIKNGKTYMSSKQDTAMEMEIKGIPKVR